MKTHYGLFYDKYFLKFDSPQTIDELECCKQGLSNGRYNVVFGPGMRKPWLDPIELMLLAMNPYYWSTIVGSNKSWIEAGLKRMKIRDAKKET